MNEAVQSDFQPGDLDAGDIPAGRDRSENALVAALALATAHVITLPEIPAQRDLETNRILPGSRGGQVIISEETARLMRAQIQEASGTDLKL